MFRFVVLYTQIDVHGKLTEYAIDAWQISQLKRGGAEMGSFLSQIYINYCTALDL